MWWTVFCRPNAPIQLCSAPKIFNTIADWVLQQRGVVHILHIPRWLYYHQPTRIISLPVEPHNHSSCSRITDKYHLQLTTPRAQWHLWCLSALELTQSRAYYWLLPKEKLKWLKHRWQRGVAGKSAPIQNWSQWLATWTMPARCKVGQLFLHWMIDLLHSWSEHHSLILIFNSTGTSRQT